MLSIVPLELLTPSVEGVPVFLFLFDLSEDTAIMHSIAPEKQVAGHLSHISGKRNLPLRVPMMRVTPSLLLTGAVLYIQVAVRITPG